MGCASPARWWTLEFVFHYAVVAHALCVLFNSGRALTEALSPTGGVSRLPGVQPGLLPGTHVDLSDAQWRLFRAALPLLAAVALMSSAATRLVRHVTRSNGLQAPAELRSTYAQVAAFRPDALLPLHLLFGLAYTAYLYGGKAVLLLALASAIYAASSLAAGTRSGPAVLWVLNCGTLLWVQVYGKRSLGQLFPFSATLDGWHGASRWDTSFNMSMLRMLSFGLDLHWARQRLRRTEAEEAAPAAAAAPVPPTRLPDIQRQLAEHSLPDASYNFPLFLAYILFPPLSIAGPIISFNAFAHQLLRTSIGAAAAPAVRPRAVALTALRVAAVLACLEGLTHALHCNAVAVSGAWRGNSAAGNAIQPVQLAAVGYWTLTFMWLKFTAIWRLFRLWSLACGVAPPENMLRCVSNNYDVEGFWKGWHASFNRWLVRYLYIPLGGSAWRVLNVWVVFTFVALWHDLLEPRLLGWAWASALCLAPELALKRFATTPWARARQHRGAYRHAAAALAACNITALMAANLVGFVLGLEGVRSFASRMFGADGRTFAAGMLCSFFCAAHLMFEVRAGEARRAAAPMQAAEKDS